ncbi:molybdopterin molybdotransferase MoeA [Pseudonocardia hispaniensis]|uniref:Molybdopterin molybdenumtransferase n=1 Tax=Pseudonocardia hispaniensis TaxID=904933 RepID=A0ABW1J8U9_9PSEU
MHAELTRLESAPKAPVSWDAARERAHAAAAPVSPRPVPLGDALGAVLAMPLVAAVAVPAVDRSAMDGYAVCGDPPWTVVGRVAAGLPTPGPLSAGQAYAVVTGAALPERTTAVLRDEDATLAGDRLTGTVTAGRHIRRAGEECGPGEPVVPAGAAVVPAVLGLAAALGCDELCVRPAPRVAAIVTGDELTDHGPPRAERVRDAIGPMLPGLVAAAGGRCTGVVRLRDSRPLLVHALRTAEAEVVLVSGSSAAGPADHLRAALSALGAEFVVDGVACRPGHPQALARLPGGGLVIGLPGNPLAALAAFLTLAVPVLAGLRGESMPRLGWARASDLAVHPDCTRLVPVSVRDGLARAVGHAGSAMLRGAAVADAFAVVAPGTEPSRADPVRLLPLTPEAQLVPLGAV